VKLKERKHVFVADVQTGFERCNYKVRRMAVKEFEPE
jgi:hypothetical protein